MKYIPISLGLLLRICNAFLAMQAQGAKCPDATLMEDLDKELNYADTMTALMDKLRSGTTEDPTT